MTGAGARLIVVRSQDASMVVARSESDEAIRRAASGKLDCFASLAMTVPPRPRLEDSRRLYARLPRRHPPHHGDAAVGLGHRQHVAALDLLEIERRAHDLHRLALGAIVEHAVAPAEQHGHGNVEALVA